MDNEEIMNEEKTPESEEILNQEEFPEEEAPQEERPKELSVIRKIVRKKKEDVPETIDVPEAGTAAEEIVTEAAETATEETAETISETPETEPAIQEAAEVQEEAAAEEITKETPEAEEETMSCPHCGRQIPVIAKHCPYCGKALGQKAAADSAKKKKLILAGAIALAVVAFLLFALPAIQKSSKYKNAVKLLNEGNYMEAAETFRELEGYKDCDDYVVYCSALDALSNGDLEKAVSRFESVSELADSNRYISYISALQDISEENNEMNFTEAKELFEAAEGLLDSEGMAKYCEGVLSFLNDKDSDAISQLSEVINASAINGMYLNSADNIIRFLNAKGLFDKDDYSGLEEFRQIANSGGRLVSSKASDYANYIEGKEFYEQELFYSANLCFNRCRSFKDAAELAESCYQERPSSGIIYRNTTSGSVSVTIYDTKDDDDMFVKIYDSDDMLVESLYIRDGSSATAYFQGGSFRMAIATGESEYWFGPNEAFGALGSYQRLLLNGNNEYYSFPSGNSFTLKFNVSNGNVDNKPSNYGDF